MPFKDQITVGQLQDIQEEFIFQGYPTGNFLKQVCVVMSLWQQCGRFPIKFLAIPSLQEHD